MSSPPALREEEAPPGPRVVAPTVEDYPNHQGGAAFPTHVLREASGERVEFRFGPLMYLCLAAALGIVGPLLGLLVRLIARGDVWTAILVFLSLAGFVAVLVVVAARVPPPSSFDKTTGRFRQGLVLRAWREVPLSRIVGVQVVGETVEYVTQTDYGESRGKFRAHELNVVLDDMSRCTIVDHTNVQIIADQADRLARFLEVPRV